MKRLLAAIFATVFVFASQPRNARAEDAKLAVIVFPGVQNLPMFAAQANGFYAKRGLSVDLKFTPNSDELRNGLAEGRYQIAHSAIDNAFALKEKANVDIAVVLGGDNSFNHLMVQPDIKSLADIKGKTVVVDAINTAYAFQLYEMLRQKGLNKGDYEVKSVGGTGFRLDAMTKDGALVAAIRIRRSRSAARRRALRTWARFPRRSAPIKGRLRSCCAHGARRMATRWSSIWRPMSRDGDGLSILRIKQKPSSCWPSGSNCRRTSRHCPKAPRPVRGRNSGSSRQVSRPVLLPKSTRRALKGNPAAHGTSAFDHSGHRQITTGDARCGFHLRPA